MKCLLIALALLTPVAASAMTTTYSANCGGYAVLTTVNIAQESVSNDTTIFKGQSPVMHFDDTEGYSHTAYLPDGGIVSNFALGEDFHTGYFIFLVERRNNTAALTIGDKTYPCYSVVAKRVN